MLERLFKLSENGTNVRTEIIAGITTFPPAWLTLFLQTKLFSDMDGV